MVKRAGSESLVVDLHGRLRAAVLDRRLLPGERLRPTDLSRHFGVSFSVMREVLAMLAAGGLVRIERNRGFYVTSLTSTDLTDLTAVRKINEGAALRLAIGRGGMEWEKELLAAHDELMQLPLHPPGGPTSPYPGWAAAHIAFHRQTIAPCGNTRLLDLCSRSLDIADLHNGWAAEESVDCADLLRREHRALLESVLARNADRAVLLLEEHLDHTLSRVLPLGPDVAPPRRTRPLTPSA